MYSQLQPFSRPDIDDLVGNRIDVLYSVDLDGAGTKGLRWCQGEVVEVIQNVPQPTVEVKWDPMPDIAGFEQGGITNQVLLPTKWNKDGKDGAWRMDVDIEVESDEDVSDNKSEAVNESESEEELEDSDE
jgi:hypothetical protein